ncbi:MAG: aminotransferase class I and II [Chloroflexi bacterium]|nr:aminotransferase class I and II [Chloroflexota bacterium]
MRYVLPLREGGSLPAVVDTDRGPFVVKFLGSGHGARALIAELIAARLAEQLELPIPAPAIVMLEAGFGAAEPDPEIQDLLRGSAGPNFGLAFLPGALGYEPAADSGLIDPTLAASIVWFDAYLTNPDRSPRNTNILVWDGHAWLIDHGSVLYVHHRWAGWRERIQSPFPQIRDHVLLPIAGDLHAADERLRPRLSAELLEEVVSEVPAEWLEPEPASFASVDEQRAAYVSYLTERLAGARSWLDTAIEAQRQGPSKLGPRLTHRVV